ncbi:hypothetical protein FGO68_gene5511 [Halteria grandinella]|uniref:Uncharacterized protein n=1 Tax=Halteria grandinella TaxID=5974 RepID=A0A8J8NP66_HALGN|nr:hypothetical protein FGO68_gene5511 [Halteria grandinella]
MFQDLGKFSDITTMNDLSFWKLHATQFSEISLQSLLELKDSNQINFILKLYLQALLNLAYSETEPERESELIIRMTAIQIVKDYVDQKYNGLPSLARIKEKVAQANQVLKKIEEEQQQAVKNNTPSVDNKQFQEYFWGNKSR